MNVTKFTFNMFEVNTYLLWDSESRQAIIVDPGMITNADCAEIDRFITENKLKLTHMVNTHMHIDHSFGVKYISQCYNLPLECNEADQFLAQRILDQAEMFGLPISIDDINIEVNLSDSDKILIGSEEIVVLHVPGHSPGSIVLYVPQSNFIISGDVLFYRSIGRTDLPGGNYSQLINAINCKLLVLPDNIIVYPGHGLQTTIGEEKKYNPYI